MIEAVLEVVVGVGLMAVASGLAFVVDGWRGVEALWALRLMIGTVAWVPDRKVTGGDK